MIKQDSSLAIIGSGATTVYILKNIYKYKSILKSSFPQILIFEKDAIMGMGMPYSPLTTDIYNLANITSEEMPPLNESFAHWLRNQESEFLDTFGITRDGISESEVYSRLVLGAYLNAQYTAFLEKLRKSGFDVHDFHSEEIIDIKPGEGRLSLISRSGRTYEVHKVVISTGHNWKEKDMPIKKFFATPWPIAKILPGAGEYHNFTVGILGASLSAFDVASSLSHRHGRFIESGGQTVYEPFAGTEQFRIVLHDAHGWLPHLQYAQAEPMRRIYRHVGRDELLGLLDSAGQLPIDTFFERVCRPALQKALRKDRLASISKLLDDPGFGMEDFVNTMTERHEYVNSFEGMRKEMEQAKDSVLNNRPIHWKEVVDDLMYCLNYHAELLPAEDHIFFHRTILPFLLNVIAAMPLRSGRILLALYDAGKLELKCGKLEIPREQPSNIHTEVVLANDRGVHRYEYKMFVVCGGLGAVEFGEYPFPTLLKQGWIRPAKAKFSGDGRTRLGNGMSGDRVIRAADGIYYLLGGIDVDAMYRIIGGDGQPNERIIDVSFSHMPGLRPYSYGLQACAATTGIMVENWAKSIEMGQGKSGEIEEVSKVYEDNPEL
jgi:hypothetical protein